VVVLVVVGVTLGVGDSALSPACAVAAGADCVGSDSLA
jgi:hypothetical protein